ncbi:MAG TPA: type II toxin-antitoxin system VapC family toxin [Pyrinomonadaceae bacterium]
MFVTDTHPLIWYSTGKYSQLSRKALSAFQKAEIGESLIYVPAVTFWEIALLENLGKIKLGKRFDFWATDLLSGNGFEIVPLEPWIISKSVGYSFNDDSFDKVIVASAVELDVPLITKDAAISEANLVEIYW